MTEKKINKEDVNYTAILARVGLEDKDAEKYTGQLEKILGYVSQLQEKNTDGVKPTAHPFDVSTVWREDEPRVFENKKGLFANAPEMEETYFRVKKVIE